MKQTTVILSGHKNGGKTFGLPDKQYGRIASERFRNVLLEMKNAQPEPKN